MSALVGDTPHEHYSAEANENEVNFMLTPGMRPEIKDEPPEDIDDIHMPMESSSGQKQLLTNGNSVTPTKTKPTITLTPTMKLMASPNPVDPKRKFPCPYENCTKSYGKSSHLRSHLTWHTGIKPYACQEPNCGKSFTRSDELNRHSRTHTGEKPFECMQCAKKFSRSDHLTKHVATHTKQMQTPKRTRTSGNHQEQQLNPKTDYQHTSATTEKCPTPKKLTAVKSELTEMSLPQEGMNYNDGMHFMASLLECAQFKHGRHVLEPENLTDEPLSPFRIKLERPDLADDHKVVNAATEKDEDEDDDGDDDDVAEDEMEDRKPLPSILNAATFQPNDCHEPATGSPAPLSLAAASVMSALSVMNTIKDESGDLVEGLELDDDDTNDDTIMPEANAPPLPLAGAPFAVPRFGLYEDDPVDPERPYRCKECIKCFKRQDDLNRHLRTHTGEKPYVCVHCPKRFMRSDHLKKHLKTHSKKR